MIRNILILCCLFVCLSGNAQKTPKELHDSIDAIIFSNPELAIEFAKEEVRISDRNKTEYVVALIDLGTCQYYSDDYSAGRLTLKNALVQSEKLKDEEGKAWALFYLGDLDILIGNFDKAAEQISRAKTLFEQLKNEKGIAMASNGLGMIHLEQENYEKAMSFFKLALNHGNKITNGDSYANLSRLYLVMEAYSGAKKAAFSAWELGKKNQDDYVIATAMDVLGFVSVKAQEYTKALNYLEKSIALKSKLGDLQGLSITYLNLAITKKALNQKDSAHYYVRKAYTIAQNIGAKEEIKNAALYYSKLLANDGKYDSAFFFQNTYIQLNTEIYSQKTSRKMAEMETAFMKKQSQQQIQLLEQKGRFERKQLNFYILFGIIGFVLLLVILGFGWNRYRTKNKLLSVVESRNEIIETQNNEILQSIRYAKRLQEAILPEVSTIQNFLPKSFISYIPKDIVAGDFYWFEPTMNGFLLACCDCTGHGVPGALVSIVCSNAMNRSVREYQLETPGDILAKTRDLVIENFNQIGANDERVNDGMDVGLLAFEIDSKTIKFSGAHHSLMLLRNGSKTLEMYKGSKAPVGQFDHFVRFETHEISVNPGDRLFLFTDGYADQFGGSQGKKLKTSQLKNLLETQVEKDFNSIQQELESFWYTWKGNEEQVDDVCFIGIEI